ncbi:unnamed protein product [Lampetra planeri]
MEEIMAEKENKTIIFVETKRRCDELTRRMRRDGWPAMCIHGDKSQPERDWVLTEFRSGKSPILIATDVASRGLDVEDIKFVINYDYPNSSEDYVHRIGRTGRSTRSGTAYTFFTPGNGRQANDLVSVLREANQAINPKLLQLAEGGRGGGGGMGGRGSRYGRSRFDDRRGDRGDRGGGRDDHHRGGGGDHRNGGGSLSLSGANATMPGGGTTALLGAYGAGGGGGAAASLLSQHQQQQQQFLALQGMMGNAQFPPGFPAHALQSMMGIMGGGGAGGNVGGGGSAGGVGGGAGTGFAPMPPK